MAAAIAYIDDTLMNGTPEDVQALKTKFGSESLQDDDFATWVVLLCTSHLQDGH